MANRVLVGRRNATSVGIYVSKPGQDVLTAPPDQLLLSSEAGSLQIVASGVIASPSTTTTITIPDLGFRPIIFFSCNRGIGNITYNSNTSVSVAILSNQSEMDIWWGQVGKPTLNGELRYAVTNIPMA